MYLMRELAIAKTVGQMMYTCLKTVNSTNKLYYLNEYFSIIHIAFFTYFQIQASLTVALGSLHYDELFDYSSQLNDEKAKGLVSKYYKKLKEEIKPIIESRNRKRYSKGQLTYPYLVPGFIPNSIST